MRRLDLKEFIRRSNLIHNNFYDYSSSIYVDMNTKIKIICPEHGIFEQIPRVHVSGNGCPKCVGKHHKSTADFINEVNIIHNNFYDYSLVNYIGIFKKIEIICPQHGIFEQRASDHLRGSGCTKCSNNIKRKSIERFLEEINHVHGNKYDYSIVNYVNNDTKIDIICKKHGRFSQRAGDHRRGVSCPKCALGNSTKVENEWLDYMLVPDTVNNRQKNIYINGKRYKVDGHIAETNTVYEYNGDFWHGNPILYKHDDINPKNKKKFGELYNKTQIKKNAILNAGFNHIEIWDSVWKQLREEINNS